MENPFSVERCFGFGYTDPMKDDSPSISAVPVPPRRPGQVNRLFGLVALWQTLLVFSLVAMIWIKEILDIPNLLFGAPPSKIDWLGALVLTISVLTVGLILVAHTYLQQKRILHGFISVCSYCHKVHVEAATWQQMEEFIANRTRAEFTHGICPICYEKALKEIETDSSFKPVST